MPGWFYAQSAVVPYRLVDGLLEVLLITSRRRRRWTLPKGIVERGMTAAASAAKEAYEEAGVRGDVGSVPLGAYDYRKWGGTCRVEVYPLRVLEELDAWPEAHERERRWLPLAEAIDAVRKDDLRRLLGALEGVVLARDQERGERSDM